MDRLDAMRVFVAVAEAGSFAAAARRLGLSAPGVTRAVAALEARLGTRLLHRTTRLVRPSEAGERYLTDCRRLLAELDDAEAAASGVQVEPQGQLAVTASVLFGRLYVAPLLLDFLGRHPRVTAHALFVDRIVHLHDEGFDVAVRIAHLPDSSLTAVRVGWVRRVVVAAPAYLAAHGEPQTPHELAAHRAIGFVPGASMGAGLAGAAGGAAGPASVASWRFVLRPGAAPQEVAPPHTPLTVNGGEVAIEAACAGHGLTRALSYQVAGDVAAGRLRVLLAGYEPPPIPIHLVYPEGRRATAKVRAFVDFAAEALRGHPALQQPGGT